MISASHNPYEDNGLKVFDHSGFKLPDAEELLLEEQILQIRENASVPACSLALHQELADHYLDFLLSTFHHTLSGLRMVVDCANGAASQLAPRLFTQLGAEVITVANRPDGRNINAGVGALHTDHVRDAVLRHKADIGIAFDGDADRAMFQSATGARVDGDAVLLICARLFKAADQLPGNRVVSTVMSNLGLELALQQEGITLTRTAVGDKYVLEEMIRSCSNLGGEQSGHVIFPKFATTGDGMLTALRVLEAMMNTGQSLDQLTAGFVIFPQLLLNVRIAARIPLEDSPAVQAAIANCEQDFGPNGRVLVRFSGTEPLARVMVEGNDESKVQHHAHAIAATIEAAMGIK
jgi:phosphoglucosamine mutase